jgi:hypothetical protein
MARVVVRDEVMEEVVYDSQEEQDAWPDSQPRARSQKDHAVQSNPQKSTKDHKVSTCGNELIVVESRFTSVGQRLFFSDRCGYHTTRFIIATSLPIAVSKTAV